MKTFVKTIVGAALGVLMFAPVSQAATFSLDFSVPMTVFDMPAADATTGSVFEGMIGTDTAKIQYRTPWENTIHAQEKYTSVQANSSATYNLISNNGKVSFVWGSVDFFNTVVFYKNGAVVDYLKGQPVIDAGALAGSSFAQISIMAGGAFDQISFLSSQNAFEFANLRVSAVPLPESITLYGAGVFVLALLGWRRRRQQA